MSYEEKGEWVYLVVTLMAFAGYATTVFGMADGPVAQMPYVRPLLTAIAVAIVASVVGRIVVEIVRPSDNQSADVRDKDINRRGEYVGGAVLGVGMVVPLGLTMAEVDHFWIANAMYLVFVVSAVVGTVVKLVSYRRGW